MDLSKALAKSEIIKLLLDKYADREKPDVQKYIDLAEQCGSSRYIEKATEAGITEELIDFYIKRGDRSAKICQSMLDGYASQANPNMAKYADAAVKYRAMDFIDKAMAMPETAGLILDAMDDRYDRSSSLPTEVKKSLLDRYAASENPDLVKYIGLAMQNESVAYLLRSAEADVNNFYHARASHIVHWAARHGHNDLIRALGDRGFQMHHTEPDEGNTPLHHAETKETAELLLSFQPHLLTTLNAKGQSPRAVAQEKRGRDHEVTTYLLERAAQQPTYATGNLHASVEAWHQDPLCNQMTKLALRCGGNPQTAFSSFVPGPHEQQAMTLTFTGQYARELASALAVVIAPRCDKEVRLKIKDREVKLSFTAPGSSADRALIANILLKPELLDNIEARMQAAQKLSGKRDAFFFPLLDSQKLGFLSYKPFRSTAANEHYDIGNSQVIAEVNNDRRNAPAHIVSFYPDNQQAVATIKDMVPLIARS